jgi:[acyl-carrier-protein] S-malonyltransferase
VRTAFLIPGQGAGTERDCAAWCARSERVRRLVEIAANEVSIPLPKLLAAAPQKLLPTEVLEPVHTALCLGIYDELLSRGIRPDAVAGHSLGEIAACAVAGSCSAECAIALAAERGRLMAREASKRPGGMVLLSASTVETAEAAVAYSRSEGIVAIAAYNAPGQWLISGEWPSLRRLATRFPATPVPVAGAWHSDVLAGAVEEFREACRRVLGSPLRIPLVSNRTGLVVERTEDLPDLLAEQFTYPVLWTRTLSTLLGFGVAEWVTVGPGRALRVWLHLCVGPAATLHTSDSMEDLERAAASAR